MSSRIWATMAVALLIWLATDACFTVHVKAQDQAHPAVPSGVAGTEPLAEKHASRLPADAVVLLSVEWGSKTFRAPGLVVYAERDRAFVWTSSLTSHFSAGSSPPAGQPKIDILWGGENPRRVRGELVAPFQVRPSWIVSGPADQLPAPPTGSAFPKLSEPMAVLVVGFASPLVQGVGQPLPNRQTVDATLTRIFYRSVDDIAKLQIEGDEVKALGLGLALTKSGQAIGYRLAIPSMRDNRNLFWSPIETLPHLLGAEVTHIGFAPVSGNEEFVKYEFVVTASDPLDRWRSPRLYVKAIDSSEPTPARNQPIMPDRPALSEAAELRLAKRPPSAIVAEQLAQYRQGAPPNPSRNSLCQ